ncbi:hypothetical protein G6L15_08420 [Agrobacterium rhizogenes]|uniref:hypothetical protein n=1 Tax=Rhizobium rhizogenes TaxID=359 RepID=UPI0015719CC1|nr:hypothetical protein [Rhizobium rhizogenes]NTG86169.1 hypothetical protein [Rhizobium rhizogenes]
MTSVGKLLIAGLKDIQACRYRSITYTPDGTVIIVDAETGKSASGRNLKEAEANFRGTA